MADREEKAVALLPMRVGRAVVERVVDSAIGFVAGVAAVQPWISMPPLTSITAPVTWAERSEARKR
jgi:hypothetical protein